MARTKKQDFNDFKRNHPKPAVSLKFEEGLKKIGEATPIGPRLNLIWGCYANWWRLGAYRLKYLIAYAMDREFKRDKTTGILYAEDKIVEIGLPRHIVEVWLPPSYFGSDSLNTESAFALEAERGTAEYESRLKRWEASWNENRYEFYGVDNISVEALARDFSKDQDIQTTLSRAGAQLVDILGPFPVNGDYRHFYTIETESGEYKDPDMSDLDFIREAYRAGYEAPMDLAQQEREYLYNQSKQESELREYLFDRKELHNEARLLTEKRPMIYLGK